MGGSRMEEIKEIYTKINYANMRYITDLYCQLILTYGPTYVRAVRCATCNECPELTLAHRKPVTMRIFTKIEQKE